MLEKTISGVSFPNIFISLRGGGRECHNHAANPQISKYNLLKIFVPPQFLRACCGPERLCLPFLFSAFLSRNGFLYV